MESTWSGSKLLCPRQLGSPSCPECQSGQVCVLGNLRTKQIESGLSAPKWLQSLKPFGLDYSTKKQENVLLSTLNKIDDRGYVWKHTHPEPRATEWSMRILTAWLEQHRATQKSAHASGAKSDTGRDSDVDAPSSLDSDSVSDDDSIPSPAIVAASLSQDEVPETQHTGMIATLSRRRRRPVQESPPSLHECKRTLSFNPESSSSRCLINTHTNPHTNIAPMLIYLTACSRNGLSKSTLSHRSKKAFRHLHPIST
jgi:hypothetical protein